MLGITTRRLPVLGPQKAPDLWKLPRTKAFLSVCKGASRRGELRADGALAAWTLPWPWRAALRHSRVAGCGVEGSGLRDVESRVWTA